MKPAPTATSSSTDTEPNPLRLDVLSTTYPDAVVNNHPATSLVAEPSLEGSDAAVLIATQKLFTWKDLTTGACCILFELVRRDGLFKRAGFDSMQKYAAATLNVKTSAAFKQYSRGGKSAWDHMPALAQRVVESIVGGDADTRVSREEVFQTIPSVSVLRELGAALDRTTDPEERAALLDQVQAGNATHRGLREAGRLRPSPPADPGVSTGSVAGGATVVAGCGEDPIPASASSVRNGDASNGDRVPSTDNNTTRAAATISQKSAAPPPIFEDVEDLEGGTRNIRETVEIFTGIVRYWADNPSPDVAPVLPKLRSVTNNLVKIRGILERQIIPRKICGRCHGKGRKCGACSGAGWLPSMLPAATKGPSEARTKPKATTATKATKGKGVPAKTATARAHKKAKAPKRG